MWSAIWYVGYLFDLTLASSYLWTQHLFLVDWFSPLVIGSVIWGQLTYNNYSKENKLRLQIKKQFEHYLSPDMVKKLQKNPSLLKLGGERKELTFMFSDIRGFTPISESMKDNPEELTRYVNKFLTAMTDIILKNGGTIDKYMGDCIMAFWNAPIDCKNHRELAVKSAIEMKTKLDQMNKNAEFNPPLKIGIGLNTGDCLVGNMGSEQRFDYSVIGDAVNLASRLEGVSKYYDTTIIISENTADGIDFIPLSRPKGFKFYKVDNTFVKGKKEKISIFSVH
jgi:adenylate cyclase